ncbi:prenyltransferase [Calidifontibacillus erzurumensis]|uniref:Prenyltransferase n=1 Tax=Calidifontibacillus erzurumensis TaxID=2741433 RepID=A0A8J8GIY1_9BACI|nr:prenyltransferase [Calidifontibacillus erzurumensis]NSL53208.1 prenyltransferase [Calidifontibacillus erzurumensis]
MAVIEKNNFIEKKWLVYRESWFQLIRPLTFTGTLSPAIAGAALAKTFSPFRYDLFLAVLIVGLFVQSAVNMLNDYYDYQKGQDQEKWVVSEKISYMSNPPYHSVPLVAFTLFILAIIISIWVSIESHVAWILAIGGLGILSGYKYSAGKYSLSSLGLAEVIAFIFLGLFPTFVGYVVQSHAIDFSITALALPYAFVIMTMLLTNNIRDIQKDENIRRTLAMRLGRNRAAHLLTIILAIAYLSVFSLIYFRIIPLTAFFTIIALPAACKLRWLLRKNATRQDEMKSMKWAAIHHWIFGMTLALSLWFFA